MAEGPDPEKRFDDSELLDMSQGDPAQARLLRKSLETLAAGHGGDALKEMAREVLSGRSSLREAANVSAYSEGLIEQARPMTEKWASMSDVEREEVAAEGRRAIAAEQEQIDGERREAAAEAAKKQRHDGRGWSLY
ncbi:hypothetical protein RCO28_05755 [Streptomyces sp. LHD-70]|uniref:hypothetical protein n=1 Tax=Streptomyces sp. LHD-70 TaxID=3072140 RepID=UPI00280D9EF6|nr:hypothetical protein [Streptomyces sp. LHD-70]MDQ8701996.1 hypothetical protein [Streptomyces sp. LHD-70]